MVDGPRNPQEPEGLFAIEEVLPPIGEGREHDTSTRERAEHLVEALNYYDSVATTMTLLRKFEDPTWLKQRKADLGDVVVYKWRRTTQEKHTLFLDGAKAEFLAAYPAQDLVDQQGLSPEEADAETARRYDIFRNAYMGTSQSRVQKRQAVREEYLRLTDEQLIAQAADERAIVEADLSDFPPENPDAKVSLARALRPEFSQLSEYRFAGISEEQLNTYHPNFFRDALVNVSPGTPNSRDSQQMLPGSTRPQRVNTVFTPVEWSVMLRSNPQYLGDTAFNRSEVAQRKKPAEERDEDAARRARIAVNRNRAEAMDKHIAEDLDVSLDVIDRFREAARFNGGLARFGNEANMRAQLEYFWDHIVSDMVWAARIVNGWTYEKEEQVQIGLRYAVHFAPTPKQRLERMMLLADAAAAWIDARKSHMQSRAIEARHYADQHETEQEISAARAVSRN